MKILQLCHKPPQPKIDGGCIAINNISEGLLVNGVELKILTASTEKHPFLKESIKPDFVEQTSIEAIFLDTRVNIIDAFSALVTSDSYNVSRFFSPDFNKRVTEILLKEKFDFVHVESLFMTPYLSTIRKYSNAKIVLRSHNLEHLIWERLANSTGNKAKKIYLKHLASKLKKYEKRTFTEVDGIATISFEDTKRYKEFGCKVPIKTIPFGIDLEKYDYTPFSEKTFNRFFHIGAMNWEPNIEGINWLLDEIWPEASKLDLELHLAGRSMPQRLLDMNNGKLKVHGEVESAIQFMSQGGVMVVPLLSGSGMRVKIIEGMALGKPVITTSVGAEGIDYKDGENIIIADSDKDFIEKTKTLLNQPSKAEEIGKAARALVEKKYDNTKIVQDLIKFYQDL